MDSKGLERYLPLTHTTYYILLALHVPAHGYGIMQHVQEMTEGEVELGPGTLYGALGKLTKQGLISKLDEEADSRRKYYVLSELGRAVVKEEFNRLNTLVQNSREIVENLGEKVTTERVLNEKEGDEK
ncbi:PadR family transcriptional regulator [Pullulanibacillus pueri]|uniref:PadR family transcriptional regulator n=1 Tax=Pullulanibacillus pueri TaxID=1437324 RepID=A0A8J2ZU83_9BACL|nr:helix-turn-helix transcriptional regulator [Pullulanibacillus pueri]GGH78299.1 PadR family transcriptional regulator [Pullulanibacillus pueri]